MWRTSRFDAHAKVRGFQLCAGHLRTASQSCEYHGPTSSSFASRKVTHGQFQLPGSEVTKFGCMMLHQRAAAKSLYLYWSFLITTPNHPLTAVSVATLPKALPRSRSLHYPRRFAFLDFSCFPCCLLRCACMGIRRALTRVTWRGLRDGKRNCKDVQRRARVWFHQAGWRPRRYFLPLVRIPAGQTSRSRRPRHLRPCAG